MYLYRYTFSGTLSGSHSVVYRRLTGQKVVGIYWNKMKTVIIKDVKFVLSEACSQK